MPFGERKKNAKSEEKRKLRGDPLPALTISKIISFGRFKGKKRRQGTPSKKGLELNLQSTESTGSRK